MAIRAIESSWRLMNDFGGESIMDFLEIRTTGSFTASGAGVTPADNLQTGLMLDLGGRLVTEPNGLWLPLRVVIAQAPRTLSPSALRAGPGQSQPCITCREDMR
jgi:hypothetical protein